MIDHIIQLSLAVAIPLNKATHIIDLTRKYSDCTLWLGKKVSDR